MFLILPTHQYVKKFRRPSSLHELPHKWAKPKKTVSFASLSNHRFLGLGPAAARPRRLPPAHRGRPLVGCDLACRSSTCPAAARARPGQDRRHFGEARLTQGRLLSHGEMTMETADGILACRSKQPDPVVSCAPELHPAMGPCSPACSPLPWSTSAYTIPVVVPARRRAPSQHDPGRRRALHRIRPSSAYSAQTSPLTAVVRERRKQEGITACFSIGGVSKPSGGRSS
jgi:hypothetical protein